ncbi:MAG: ATP-binding protein [Bacteroidales bacterium]|nr:ATP-binding protein [Bacteroidales bacterium]
MESPTNIQRQEVITGLGLNIVQALLRMLGSSIKIQSTVGKGTQVFIVVPDNRV